MVDGVWEPNADGLYPPLPGTDPDAFLTLDEADDKYALQVSPGLAYVQGYEVGLEQPLYVYGDKPREIEFFEDSLTQMTPGYHVTVSNANNAPDVQNIFGDGVAQKHLMISSLTETLVMVLLVRELTIIIVP